MSSTLFLIVAAIAGFFVASAFLAWFYFRIERRGREERERGEGQSLLMLQNQMGELARTLDGRLQ